MSQRTDFIIPECYIDTNLVETLTCTAGCNHQKGCNNVARIMQDKFADRFAVGMIDADKRRPGYVSEFREIASSQHIQLLQHPVRAHFIIIVHPAADGFILACAEEARINPADYGLPPALKEFTQQTKNVMSNRDSRFKRLFIALKDTGEMNLLKSLLTHLVSSTYNTSTDKLLSLFQK